MRNEKDEVMDYRGLSEYLKIPQGSLRHKVMRNGIPYFKIGRSVRFSKKQIDLWLEERRHGNGVDLNNGSFCRAEIIYD